MISREEMESLGRELAELRDHASHGHINEDDAWRLVDQTDRLLERAVGTEYEENLQLIYSMVCTVWTSVRDVEALHRVAHEFLPSGGGLTGGAPGGRDQPSA